MSAPASWKMFGSMPARLTSSWPARWHGRRAAPGSGWPPGGRAWPRTSGGTARRPAARCCESRCRPEGWTPPALGIGARGFGHRAERNHGRQRDHHGSHRQARPYPISRQVCPSQHALRPEEPLERPPHDAAERLENVCRRHSAAEQQGQGQDEWQHRRLGALDGEQQDAGGDHQELGNQEGPETFTESAPRSAR